MQPSIAPEVEPKRRIEGRWCRDIVCMEIARYSIQAGCIAKYWGLQVHFLCFFSAISPFLGRHDVKWRSYIPMLRSMDIMT